jgi:NADH-quinone oxidoreductase subunit E
MLTPENLKKLEALKSRYPTKKALTLPVLWMAQEQFGWISHETMEYVAGLLDLPVRHVYGVVTFYTMFNTSPVGKYHLQVCTNISCMLRGSDTLCSRIADRLGIHIGETTPDKKFTLSRVECLGSCGTAPMMQVNDEYHENLSDASVDNLLAGLK